MPINRFVAPPSPIDAISKALTVAHTIFGIQQASAVKDALEQDTAQKAVSNKQAQDLYSQMNDPDSQLSKLARADQSLYISAAAKYLPKDQVSKLTSLLNGSPAVGNEGEDGYQAATPGMTAYQIKQTMGDQGATNKYVSGAQTAEAQRNRLDFRDTQMQERQDYQAHQKNLSKLKGDPTLSKRLSQYQNLNNALSNFQNADIANPQAIDELQQGIRQNLGIGGGGIGEREHTYINSLGLNADRFKQFLTGDPVAISKDSDLAQHLKQLVGLEQQNISSQMSKRIGALTAGNASVYARHPEYQSDILDAINAAKDQYAPAPVEGATAVGLPGVTNANAASGSAPHISQDAIQQELMRRRAAKGNAGSK